MSGEKIILIHGPAACGKTRNAEALRRFYAADTVVDGFYPMSNRLKKFHTDQGNIAPENLAGALILTNAAPRLAARIAERIGATCVAFDVAIDDAGLEASR